MGIGDHLFNNVIVTNLLHVISNDEADSMQIVRILIGQLISFLLVVIYYKRTKEFQRMFMSRNKAISFYLLGMLGQIWLICIIVLILRNLGRVVDNTTPLGMIAIGIGGISR